MPDISIVIVNYNYRIGMLKACLDSVKHAKGVTYEVIFVDNSAAAEQANLCAQYENTTYIGNTQNVGFARAVNQGMRLAQGRYMLLLNGDVTFGDDVLERMLAYLDKDSEVGVASCVIRYPNGELQKSIRRFPTPWNQFLVMSKLPHVFSPKAYRDYMAEDIDPFETQEVESIMGAFMWIRRNLLEEVGYFDEKFFLWFEEVDYCHRTHKAGIAIKHYADIEVSHQKGASFSTVQTWRKQTWMRQSLRWYMYKHYGFGAWFAYIVLQPWFLFTAAIAHAFKRY